MEKLCDAEDLQADLMDRLKLEYTEGDCGNNTSLLLDYIATEAGLTAFENKLVISRSNLRSAFYRFLRGVVTDHTLMSYSGYTGEDGRLLAAFQSALMSYSDPSRTGSFLDQWGPAWEMLETTNSPQGLLTVVYDNDDAGFINDYLGATGNVITPVVNALAAIPTLQFPGFLQKAKAYLGYQVSLTVYEDILKYRRVSLSSHVVYGSSRLGTKDYLPGQYYLLQDNTGPEPISDTTTLSGRRPWYSGEYNDDINPAYTVPWGQTYTTAFRMEEQTGQKQYELTNHLGNVQATVSDNKVEVTDGSGGDNIIGWRPALRSAYDYYPFGMLMPGRYVTDTGDHCVTISQPKWVYETIDSCWNVYHWVWPHAIWIGAGHGSVSGSNVVLEAVAATDGASFEFPVVPHVAQELEIEIQQVQLLTGTSGIVAEELQSSGVWVSLGQSSIHTGVIHIPVTPQTNSLRVRWKGPYRVWVQRICITRQGWEQEQVLVDICNEDKDKYRFGFNGKEKINEWAGTGNYLDFGARGYDSRIARFLSLDPLANRFPDWSPYIFAYDNPISLIDENGEFGDDPRGKFYKTMGTSAIKAINSMDVNANKYKALYTLSQYRMENGFNLNAPGNNPFNLKGKGDAGQIKYLTTEYVKGKAVKMQQGFASFSSLQKGFEGYIGLLKSNFPNASSALLDNSKTITDFANGLQHGKLGSYATDPNYAANMKTMLKGVVNDFEKDITGQLKQNSIQINKNNDILESNTATNEQKSTATKSNNELNKDNQNLKNDLQQLQEFKSNEGLNK